LSNLSYDGKSALDGDAKLNWSNVQIRSDGSKINADVAKLESSAANVDAKNVNVQISPALEMSLDVKASAELTRLFKAVGTLSGMEEPPAVAGNVSLSSHASTSGEKVQADFAIEVAKLQAAQRGAAGGAPIDLRVAGK